MKKYRRYIKILRVLSIIILLLTSMGTSQKVSATSTTSENPIKSNADDLTNALKTAPRGLKWSDNNFVKAKFDGNSATIVSPSPENPNSKNTSVIQMTNDHKQVGGIWSNLTSGNFFNINEDQTVSMWLYLGFYKDNDVSNIAGTRPGDGMAFVLHNDPNGVNAHSVGYDLKEKQWLPGNGETLGVWGTDWDFNETKVANIAKNAIQNSVAIEFDTYPDASKAYGDINNGGASFDLDGVSGQHIAIGYPSNPESEYNVGLTKIPTYLQHSVEKPDGFKNDSDHDHLPTPDLKYFYSLNYLTSSSGLNLVDSKWHHLTIKWTKATQRGGLADLAYYYDDKNLDGTPKEPITSHTGINPEVFHSKDGRIYWGFTGATGKFTENNLLIFESLPSFVDVQAKPEIWNDNSNTTVTEGSHVNTKDKLTYKYYLNYVGYTRRWENIVAQITTPDNMAFHSGEIIYKDGTKQTIPDTAFKQKVIEVKLNRPLGLGKDNATVILHGDAATTSTTTLKVPQAHGHFSGDNLITDTEAPAFMIDPHTIILSSDTKDTIHISKKKDVNIPSKVDYLGQGQVDLSKLTVYKKVGDGIYNPIDNIIDKDGNFTLTVKSSELTDDATPVSFYVKDNSSTTNLGETPALNRQIQIGGTISFGFISDNISFQSINYGKNQQLIPRLDKCNVDVIDSRAKGASQIVKAVASPLINKSTKKEQVFDGKLIYREKSDSPIQDLSNPVTIFQHNKDSDDTDTQNITSNWTKDTGILLSTGKKINPAGKYTGTIQWSILDALENN